MSATLKVLANLALVFSGNKIGTDNSNKKKYQNTSIHILISTNLKKRKMDNWKKVYTNQNQYQAEIVKTISVLPLNSCDSSTFEKEKKIAYKYP